MTETDETAQEALERLLDEQRSHPRAKGISATEALNRYLDGDKEALNEYYKTHPQAESKQSFHQAEGSPLNFAESEWERKQREELERIGKITKPMAIADVPTDARHSRVPDRKPAQERNPGELSATAKLMGLIEQQSEKRPAEQLSALQELEQRLQGVKRESTSEINRARSRGRSPPTLER